MSLVDVCLIRSSGPAGEPVLRLGVEVLDDYLEFLAVRSRPNTVLAVAYDLKVFFTVVGKSPEQVVPRDVLAFMTAQRTGQPSIAGAAQLVAGAGLGSVERGRCGGGCRACRGCTRSCRPAVMWRRTRCRVGCRLAGNGIVRVRACRWCGAHGRCRGSCPRPRSMR